MRLVILTGASGSGKTAIAAAVAKAHPETFAIHHFDSVGIPPVETMIRDHGSPEGWQRHATVEWMRRLAGFGAAGKPILFEGQMRLSFIAEATAAAGFAAPRILLVDCNDEVRRERLISGRGQPELADETMMNWARFLRKEAAASGCEIFDTSRLALEQCVAHVIGCFNG